MLNLLFARGSYEITVGEKNFNGLSAVFVVNADGVISATVPIQFNTPWRLGRYSDRFHCALILATIVCQALALDLV
jgi:hypothetical protein